MALTSVVGVMVGVIGFAADLRELGVPIPRFFSDVAPPTPERVAESAEPATEEPSESPLSCWLGLRDDETIPSPVPVEIANVQYKAVNAVVNNIPVEALSSETDAVRVRCGADWEKSFLRKTDGECRISYPCRSPTNEEDR